MKTNIFITTIVLVLGAFFTFSQAQTDKTIVMSPFHNSLPSGSKLWAM